MASLAACLVDKTASLSMPEIRCHAELHLSRFRTPIATVAYPEVGFPNTQEVLGQLFDGGFRSFRPANVADAAHGRPNMQVLHLYRLVTPSAEISRSLPLDDIAREVQGNPARSK
jgi:hypothetical protein